MKFNIATASGNIRVALYSDSSGASALLSESASLTAVTGYAQNYPITEVQVNATTAWMAQNQDSGLLTWYYWNDSSRNYRSFTYGAMPNPFGTLAGSGALGVKMKIGHS